MGRGKERYGPSVGTKLPVVSRCSGTYLGLDYVECIRVDKEALYTNTPSVIRPNYRRPTLADHRRRYQSCQLGKERERERERDWERDRDSEERKRETK